MEVWGPHARPDPLNNLFELLLMEQNLFDVEVLKVNPTWKNKRIREERWTKGWIGSFSQKIWWKHFH